MNKHAAVSLMSIFRFVFTILTFGLFVSATSATQIVWDPSSDSTVTGYVVHVGSSSGVYTTNINVGPATSYVLPPQAAGTTSYFAVTAYNATGAESPYSNEVSYSVPAVASPPVAAFSASVTAGLAPLALNFTSASTGSITSYAWTFGDGTSSASQNPAKAYASPGVYTVSLQVTGPGGTNTQTKANYITVTAPVDTTPPSVPANPSATPLSSSSISIAWSPATDNVGVVAYRLERCRGTACTSFAQIATPGGSPYLDVGLASATTYQYRVRAVDAAGNFGGYSAVTAATTSSTYTKDRSPPSTPGTPIGVPAGTTGINLSWISATDNVGVVGYQLDRCRGMGCNKFSQIAAPSGPSFSDTGLSPGTTYRYRVRAYDAAGNTGRYSSILTITLPSIGATIAFVQLNYMTPQGSAPTVQVPFASAQSAGNLNVVVVGWNDVTSTVTSVTDSMGNVYTKAVGPHSAGTALSQSIYYAKNIKASGASGNTVTVKFSGPSLYPDIRIVEYRGLDPVNPVDVTAAGTGTGTLAATSSATTTTAYGMLFAATTVTSVSTGPGTGFTKRVITTPDGDIVEDRVVNAVGTYSATAPMTSGEYVIQMVAFRGAP